MGSASDLICQQDKDHVSGASCQLLLWPLSWPSLSAADGGRVAAARGSSKEKVRMGASCGSDFGLRHVLASLHPLLLRMCL